ncbi:A/G-specific adenine glycosylase [Fredinandcohnia quinoae]|uniref:Adenine DNA glycosylase n=1 Tax=Fredinandcohnia quinoae TaxID=2918902 RepID=A0AAW5E7Q3_9BACI|nr:A/G-specific adenine glycosylase [Fredinandcohnia sp. SECRCQ15]MCH1627524.1 A/G-specific adenine glycosylase [Fredinandcohnia sp. SECRCQ15]
MNKLDHFNIDQFQLDLISWFEQEQRDLPWRMDKDPYKVWVSEIMLQQTRVDTVIPYFNNFIDQFPTIETLAEAEEEKVLKAWEGLGYYSRVRNLHAAVKEVAEKYGGQVPNTAKEISKLKGVGPYTTGAILSIAYGVPEPAVDGNVMRVLSRILSIWDDIAKPKTRQQFEDIIREIISKENPSFFNQALMELGALICIPANPACLLCPVRNHCRAFAEGVQKELPVKSKKKAPVPLSMAAVVLQNEDKKLLIHKRPDKGLLANLWEFPNHESISELYTQKEQLSDFINQEFKIQTKIGEAYTTIQHIFSHLIWNITVFEGEIIGEVIESDSLKLVTVEELRQFTLPVSHQNILKSFLDR